MLQMDNYFAITHTCNEQQQLANVCLYTEGNRLNWWNTNTYKYDAREEVKDVIGKYNGKQPEPDRALKEIRDFTQTDTVQKYQHDIDRLNGYS